MNNKNLIIGGVIVAGIVAYYFYDKNKGGGLASSSNPSEPTMSGIPKPYDNTENCERQYTKYRSSLPPRLTKEYISPKAQEEIKQNWIKNNCSLKM
jgi:hypothetical protein